MFSKFNNIKYLLKNNYLKTEKEKFGEVLKDYNFIYICDDITNDQNIIISKSIIESRIIVISHYKEINTENSNIYFIIVFKKTILVIKQQILVILIQKLLSKIEICFLPNTKNLFDQFISVDYKESSSINNKYYDKTTNNKFFKEEYDSFYKNLKLKKTKHQSYNEILNIWLIIIPCLSVYLIQQSYIKSNRDRIDKFYNTENEQISINTDDFIELRQVGSGSLFQMVLIYHIEKEQFYAIKKPCITDDEIPKLLKREKENYIKINHPFLPNFYGANENPDFLVCEFINGRTLSNIDRSHFSKIDELSNILQLLSVFYYLHSLHLIYRDLKKDNIMIDQNNTIVLIDFDRMIDENHYNDDNDSERTRYLDSNISPPEINNGKLSTKSDVYSIGYIIYNLIKEKELINPVFNKCIIQNLNERPNIKEIIYDFFEILTNKMNCNIDDVLQRANINDPEMQCQLGCIYLKNEHIETDFFNKAIYYFTLAADQNYPKAQYVLGHIYFEPTYCKIDINKSIYYLSLASQNIADAYFDLAVIYYTNEYVNRDIDKAINYLLQAASFNIIPAYYNLGLIYYEGKYVERDIELAISCFSYAAKENFPAAEYCLGEIYFNGEYITRDTKKAIHYLTLAADHNNSNAQYYLGEIYYLGECITRDIEKAIYYFSLAAEQNNSDAQHALGSIYYENKYISQDLNKSIYYYLLAAEQNNEYALYNLALFYFDEKYVQRDINRAIYYFQLAANLNHPQSLYNLGDIYYFGENVPKDINKAIYYHQRAANLNFSRSNFRLGVIFYSGTYIIRDINKAINYFSLAANDNNIDALHILGVIYSDGKYIPQNIEKAIYFFTLAADKNHLNSMNNLGVLYYESKYKMQNIDKAIYYFTLASNHYDTCAEYNLGLIYYEGKYINQDINKEVHYLSLAASQNNSLAQCFLGFIYLIDLFTFKNAIKGIDLLICSSNNNNYKAKFAVGYFYHEGKYVKRDINKSIQYYKESSSFNNIYAKNNLGVIYKNGYKDEIPKNIGLAISYFEEGIKRFNNRLSMYNLSHIYIYEDQTIERINLSIDLLIKSLNLIFIPSIHLLCIALIMKHGFDFEKINQEILNKTEYMSDLPSNIYELIQYLKLFDENNYEKYYEYYKTIDYIYDFQYNEISSNFLFREEKILPKSKLLVDITPDFYDGFGI